MFEREISGPSGGDATAPYSITFTGEYTKQHPTIEEFIYYVINHNQDEWGTFRIEVEDTSNHKRAIHYIRYRYGKFEDPAKCLPILSKYGKLRIKSVKASGGWSSMDYDINYETSDVKHPDSCIDEKDLDEWLKDFQRNHHDGNPIDRKYMLDLACALHDDIPFGYEASMRLSNWIFVYLNQPILDESVRKQMRSRYEIQKIAAENLKKALNDYIDYTQEFSNAFICLER